MDDEQVKHLDDFYRRELDRAAHEERVQRIRRNPVSRLAKQYHKQGNGILFSKIKRRRANKKKRSRRQHV